MPRLKIDFETVRELARELGDVSEAAQAIKAGGNLWAWIPPHKSIEPGTIAVRLGLEQRAELIECAPEVYYVTDHYLNASAVLVRLGKIDQEALRGLLVMSREFVVGATKKKRPKR